MPRVIQTVGNLQLLQNTFGLCVREKTNSEFGDQKCNLSFRISHIVCHSTDYILVKPGSTFSKQVEVFLLLKILA